MNCARPDLWEAGSGNWPVDPTSDDELSASQLPPKVPLLRKPAIVKPDYGIAHGQVQARLLRKLPGVMPTTFLNARVMWL